MRKIATTTPRRCARQASQRLRTFRDYVSFGSKADISRYGRWRGAEVPPPFLQRRINRRYANQRCGHSSATLGPRRGRLGSAWDTPPNSRIRGPKPLPTSNSNNILESLERLGVFAPRSGHRFDPANALALFNFVNSAHKFAHASALGYTISMRRDLRWLHNLETKSDIVASRAKRRRASIRRRAGRLHRPSLRSDACCRPRQPRR
jgi:hypothetical protein